MVVATIVIVGIMIKIIVVIVVETGDNCALRNVWPIVSRLKGAVGPKRHPGWRRPRNGLKLHVFLDV